MSTSIMEFEKPIVELERQIDELRRTAERRKGIWRPPLGTRRMKRRQMRSGRDDGRWSRPVYHMRTDGFPRIVPGPSHRPVDLEAGPRHRP